MWIFFLFLVYSGLLEAAVVKCPLCRNLNECPKTAQSSCEFLKTHIGPTPPVLPQRFQPLKGNRTIHAKPIPPFRDGVWISSAPSDVYRESDSWRQTALQLMWKEIENFSPTPLINVKAQYLQNVEFIFKDESFAPTSSVSYRTSWKLFFWALLQGLINQKTNIVDASFGNAAISEAYFANILNITFTAVVPDDLDVGRRILLNTYKAKVVLASPSQLLLTARELGSAPNAFFLNQYANGKYTMAMEENYFSPLTNMNILAELLGQLFVMRDQWVIPDYLISAAETGSTITSIGYFAKKYGLSSTCIVLADTQFSAYFDHVIFGKFEKNSPESLWIGPGLGGLGFGQFESASIKETTSLTPSLIDRAIKVPDLASVAAIHFLRSLKIDAGPATGISFISALSISSKDRQIRRDGHLIRIALLISDPGRFYEDTYYNQNWIDTEMGDSGGFKTVQCWLEVIKRCFQADCDPLEEGNRLCLSPTQKLLINP